MKLNRKFFFKIHGWIGIKLSILFFIVCFSGTLATLSHEMDWIFFRGMRVNPSDMPASKNQIVNNIKQNYPQGTIEYWSAAAAPYLADIVYVKENSIRWYVFVNPYTGQVQGATTLTFQRFFRDLHYFLFIPFQIGHFLVLIFAFLLFISIITGLLFYKKWYRKLFELNINKGSKVLFRSLHRLVGVWSIPFSILFSITGIWYFIERANIGGISDQVNYGAPVLQVDSSAYADISNFPYHIDYDKAISIAKSHIPQLQVKDILPPAKPGQTLYVNGRSGVPLVRNRANRVYIEPLTMEVLKVQKAKEISTVTYINDIADPLHFGYWGGLATKLIYFVAGLAISGLILTGVWISLKRKIKSIKQLKAQKMGGWKYVNYALVIIVVIMTYMTMMNRYHASWQALLTISTFILLLTGLMIYLFRYKVKQ